MSSSHTIITIEAKLGLVDYRKPTLNLVILSRHRLSMEHHNINTDLDLLDKNLRAQTHPPIPQTRHHLDIVDHTMVTSQIDLWQKRSRNVLVQIFIVLRQNLRRDHNLRQHNHPHPQFLALRLQAVNTVVTIL